MSLPSMFLRMRRAPLTGVPGCLPSMASSVLVVWEARDRSLLLLKAAAECLPDRFLRLVQSVSLLAVWIVTMHSEMYLTYS
ncbi:unnamed protein product [Ixodes pacificus]